MNFTFLFTCFKTIQNHSLSLSIEHMISLKFILVSIITSYQAVLWIDVHKHRNVQSRDVNEQLHNDRYQLVTTFKNSFFLRFIIGYLLERVLIVKLEVVVILLLYARQVHMYKVQVPTCFCTREILFCFVRVFSECTFN